MFWKRKKLQNTDKHIPISNKQVKNTGNFIGFIRKKVNGHLVLIGGAEDKQHRKKVLNEVIKINNAKNVAVIPSASSFPRDLGYTYINAFSSLGVKNVELLDIRNKDEADDEAYIEIVKQADLVFFTGGDQVKLVDRIHNTKLFKHIVQAYQTKGITIAGTSAGAAAASSPLLFDGDGKGLIKNSIKKYSGFGLIPNVTIDTHFYARRRLKRLAQSLVAGYSCYGIGLDEDTGIIIYPDDTFKVIGSGIVTLLRKKSVCISNYSEIFNNQAISIDGLEISVLQPETIFNLREWQMIP